MAGTEVKKEIVNGEVRLSAGSCVFVFRRIRPGVLHAVITGLDNGQFGTTTLDEIRAEIGRHKPVELFVDAREATGAAVSVSEEWTRFFSAHRSELSRVHVLVGSKVVSLTVAIAQHLSRTGNLIQIYSDPETFASKLPAAGGRGVRGEKSSG
ncbi:MAG: hypothetical protein JWO30_2415 [Fibrobacteres bacterium]|nr:hypothetical protein [Fibrobacterota bacterium]